MVKASWRSSHAQQHLSRYHREVEKGESRLRQVRALTGFSSSGMQR